jgi:hypothetical protein
MYANYTELVLFDGCPIWVSDTFIAEYYRCPDCDGMFLDIMDRFRLCPFCREN